MAGRVAGRALALVSGILVLLGAACRGTPAPEADRAAATQAAATPAARIAFVRGGDIYLLDTASRAEERLTSDGHSGSPAWTQGGRALLFTQTSGDQRQVWRWSPGAAPTVVQDGLWSPDGRSVALTQPAADWFAPSSVFVETNGQRTQVTPSEPDHNWEALGWSPDSSRLALAHRHLVPAPVSTDKGTVSTDTGLYPADGELVLVRADGSQRQSVLLPAQWGDHVENGWPDAVRWAPSGQVLAVWVGPPMPCNSCRADGEPILGVRVADGSTRPMGSSLGPGGGENFWAWLPWGEAIAVEGLQPEHLGRETYANKHLVRVDPAAGSRTLLTNDPQFADVEPAVSPDGRWVAFARGRAVQEPPASGPGSAPLDLIASRRLWLIMADGSSSRRLLDPPDWTDEAPAWTPDGQWIVFVRWHLTGQGPAAVAELWAVRPDGSGAQRLAAGLDVPGAFNAGVGYYGALGWQSLVAIAPR